MGAFAYYRRVIENQKDRLIAEVERVGQQAGLSQEKMELFSRAKSENRFSASVDLIKDALPESLWIGG